MTSCAEEHGAERDTPLQQENTGPSAPEESNLSPSAELPGPSQTSTDIGKNNWNYCLVQVGDVCLPGILPESLSSQIPVPTSHSELASLVSIKVTHVKQVQTTDNSNNILDISGVEMSCRLLFLSENAKKNEAETDFRAKSSRKFM